MNGSNDRAIAYIRVSQERPGMISPELQAAAIETYCAQQGYQIIETIDDLDESGRFWSRRKVERAITMIELDAADVLVVARWSRVARNRHDWAVAVDRVECVGGRLESAIEPVDVTTSAGRFTRGMLAEVAAFESDRYSEMWREVRTRRIRMGLTADGLSRFGYIRNADGTYSPDPVIGPLLASAYKRYTRGSTAADVARWLNARISLPLAPNRISDRHVKFQSGPLLRMMDHGFAAGLLWMDGDIFLPGAHACVISRRQWDAYQAARAQRRLVKLVHVDSNVMVMHERVYCHCGHAMTSTLRTTGGAAYVCEGRPDVAIPNHCAVGAHIVDASVRKWLGQLATDTAVGNRARLSTRMICERAWKQARQSAYQASSTGDNAPLGDNSLIDIESGALWADPVERAADLLDDWSHIYDQTKRRRLRQLVGRANVAPGRPTQNDRITVIGRWDADTQPWFSPVRLDRRLKANRVA